MIRYTKNMKKIKYKQVDNDDVYEEKSIWNRYYFSNFKLKFSGFGKFKNNHGEIKKKKISHLFMKYQLLTIIISGELLSSFLYTFCC